MIDFAAERRGDLVFVMMASSGLAIGAEIDLVSARRWRASLDAAIGSGHARTVRQDKSAPTPKAIEPAPTDPTSIADMGIRAWRKLHQGEDLEDVVTCAACGGRLHLRIHSQNGHVHGWCETDNCAHWIE